ncbi:MAG: flavin reductase [Bacteroidales bacterium]|jgi:flavin reductase (DIM6/NTAB) family NADH-FMN oxidoreductase RutF|nr:flavin reductase [Bacteroidales bacterium]
MKNFTSIQPADITDNTFHLIGKEWMLIVAGNEQNNNCMTASWGGFGFLWNKPVVFIFVRPQRYTYNLLEKHDFFTLNFFNETHRSTLNFCGKESGKQLNKAEICKLDIVKTPNNSIAYQQSRMIIECRKMYKEQLKPDAFIDETIQDFYPENDYHYMYIAEISNCFVA